VSSACRPRHIPWRLLGIAVLAAARPAAAQLGCAGNACTVEITMPVVDVLRLSVSAPGIGLGSPTESDYSAGYKDVMGPAVTATVKANRAFQVQMGGSGATFLYAGSNPDPAKPASDLLWATTQAGLSATSTHMGATSMILNQGTGGSVQAMIYMRALWDFTRDVPGSYTMSVRFTLSAP
jgi:hypothetical protein